MGQARTAPIRIASLIAGIVVLLLITSLQVLPQENKGGLDIQITRSGSTEGVPGVTITLQGPYPVVSADLISSLYTPNPKLTPEMRQQVDDLIASVPLAISPEGVAAAAIRMEAQLLGLPAPQNLPTAASAPATPQLNSITDASGHFHFANLAAGRYQVRAQRDGYFGTQSPVNAGISLVTAVTAIATVNPSQPAEEVKLSMVRGATVSGRVRDPNGQPLSGAQINAYQVGYQNARMALQSLNSRQTDDRGEYRLYWLPPGDYIIGVTPRSAGRGSAQDTFARTFHPGTSDGRNASRVHVTEGGEISGIDIGMRADAGGNISGHIVTSIVGPNGQPPQASTFFLLPRDQDAFTDTVGMNYPNSASDRSNGKFEIRGVVAGSYDLITVIFDPANGQSMGRARVDIGNGGSVEDVILNVKRGMQVKARLILDTGAIPYTMAPPSPVARGGDIAATAAARNTAASTTVPTPSIRLFLRSLEAYPSPFESASLQYSFDPSGEFVFSNVPEGRYDVTVNPLAVNSYIVDVRVGTRSVFDTGFEVSSLSEEIEVTVSSKGARIQGSVLDASQKPAGTVRVVLVPEPSRRHNQALYKIAVTNAKGNFTISGVAPGQYKLFAWKSTAGTAYMNPEFMTKYEIQGQVIKVMEGATMKADLKLIP